MLNKLAVMDMDGTPMASLEHSCGLLKMVVIHRERMGGGRRQCKSETESRLQGFPLALQCTASCK